MTRRQLLGYPAIQSPGSLLGFLFPLLLVLAVLQLTACAGANPLAIAETPGQRYAAAKLTYDALLTPAVELIEDTTAPTALRRSVQDLVARSGDVYRAAEGAYVDYEIERSRFAAGETTEQRLTIATANLENWLRQLMATVESLDELLDGR